MTPHDNNNLDRLWVDVPVGTPPIDDLIRGGKTMRRRARIRVVGGAAALTLAVVAGSTIAANTMFDGTSPRPDREVPAAAVDAPTAPAGQRLVGAGRVVVAVPAAWNAYGLTGCEPAAKNTIWFELENSGLDLDCPSVTYTSPTVKISPLDSDGGKAAAKFATRPRIVDGLEVFRELVACPDDAFCVGDTAVRYVVVPGEDVAFTISGPIRVHETLDAIADSVQILPDGYTTVPIVEGDNPAEWNTAIAEAGLVPDGTPPPCGPNDSCVTNPPIRPEPGPGTVVAMGSTVTLFPSAALGTLLDLPTSEWEPGDDAMQALGGGTISIDEQGCVVLTTRGTGTEGGDESGPPTYAVWPKGYTASLVDGQVTIRDQDSAVVARHGDSISAGGGYGPPPFPHSCLPGGNREVFIIQSLVTVVE